MGSDFKRTSLIEDYEIMEWFIKHKTFIWRIIFYFPVSQTVRNKVVNVICVTFEANMNMAWSSELNSLGLVLKLSLWK